MLNEFIQILNKIFEYDFYVNFRVNRDKNIFCVENFNIEYMYEICK